MLFQIKQRYNEDDLRALDHLQLKKLRPFQAKLIYFRVCAIAGALVLLFLTGAGGFWIFTVPRMIFLYPLIAFVWVIFIPYAIVILFQIALPRERIGKASLQNAQERTYTFYEGHFTIEEPDLTLRRLYTGVNKFVETDNRFFVYISSGSAYILRKSCFTAGDPTDFGPFMREKYRTKDMEPTEKGL